MDKRKLSTAQVLAAGILDIPQAEDNRPIRSNLMDVEEGEWTEKLLLKGLKKGGLKASMYYGCWKIWKTNKGYNGSLDQYRICTDEFKDLGIQGALKKAVKWATGCQG